VLLINYLNILYGLYIEMWILRMVRYLGCRANSEKMSIVRMQWTIETYSHMWSKLRMNSQLKVSLATHR